MDLQAEVTLLENKLQMPTAADMRPYLEKLIAHPGSAIIIGIEITGGAPRVGRAWLNPTERRALRSAIQRVNAARQKKGARPTSEEETAQ